MSTVFPPGPYAANLKGPTLNGPISQQDCSPATAEAHAADGMTPTDFVLWLNGALDVLNDTPPTQEQWNTMREKIAEQVGGIVHARMQRHMQFEEHARLLAAKTQAMAQIQAQLASSAMSAMNTFSYSPERPVDDKL